MPAQFTIGSARYADDLRYRLARELHVFRREGCAVSLNEHHAGGYSFFALGVEEGGAGDLRTALTATLSDLIVDYLENRLVEEMLSANHRYLDSTERHLVVGQARREMQLQASGGWGTGRRSRRNEIHRALGEYLDNHRQLLLEGFLTFRLRDQIEDIEELLDRTVDDFLMEREHGEFIKLLQHFLDTQAPQLDLMHVLVRPEGGFSLMDAGHDTISDRYLEQCLGEPAGVEADSEDLLVSALITAAPRRVVVHWSPGWGDEGVDTVRRVFAERVQLCHGCPLCQTTDE
ncbi:MAG TPA: putative sporulation protein YtxC [Bacillota bacterium]|nr:putative sporulation protein YtxC [Bacillota bacterium]